MNRIISPAEIKEMKESASGIGCAQKSKTNISVGQKKIDYGEPTFN
jgi:hypothetical protein